MVPHGLSPLGLRYIKWPLFQKLQGTVMSDIDFFTSTADVIYSFFQV